MKISDFFFDFLSKIFFFFFFFFFFFLCGKFFSIFEKACFRNALAIYMLASDEI